MENPTNVRCGAPRCSADASWRFALAYRIESPQSALEIRPQFRCTEHLTITDLTWLPGLEHGMVAVVDPNPISPGAWDDRSDTVRMTTHLIDVDELYPSGSVTRDASTQAIDMSDLRRRGLLGHQA